MFKFLLPVPTYFNLQKSVNISKQKSLFSLVNQLSSNSHIFPQRVPPKRFKSILKLKMSGNLGNPLDAVEDVSIDDTGKFKYILIKTWPKDDKNNSKYIVRGYKQKEGDYQLYHADIFDEVESKLRPQRIGCDCEGGGRIEHDPRNKKIVVYGYSQGYGQADHSIAVEKLKARYPDYTSITFNNDGY